MWIYIYIIEVKIQVKWKRTQWHTYISLVWAVHFPELYHHCIPIDFLSDSIFFYHLVLDNVGQRSIKASTLVAPCSTQPKRIKENFHHPSLPRLGEWDAWLNTVQTFTSQEKLLKGVSERVKTYHLIKNWDTWREAIGKVEKLLLGGVIFGHCLVTRKHPCSYTLYFLLVN